MKYPRRKSFTLIELVMTIVIVGIVAIPLSLTLGRNITSTNESTDLSKAIELGRLEMETAGNIAYASLASASFSNYKGYAFDVVRTVSYVHGTAVSAESTKLVNVQVKRAGSAAVLAEFNTYITRNIAYPF